MTQKTKVEKSEHVARAKVISASISTKHCVEICKFLRYKNTDFAKDLLEVDEHGHIVVNCSTETSVPGIYAAGDCSSVHEYQYVISAGTACIALLKVAKFLAKGGK